MKHLTIFLIIALAGAACNSPKSSGTGDTSGDISYSYSLQELWRTDTVLTTSESVLFDPSGNILYVSCINGTPSEKDGNGFIARLDPDGSVVEREWVTGLNAPKGMGIDGDLLYVTDIDELVVIDIPGATVRERIPVEGASFLNDISVAGDGTVYFSDSDTGYLWKYKDGEMVLWVTEGLERPNGLFVEKDRVLLTSSGSQDLKVINPSTGEYESVTPGIGYGDGVEFTGEEGTYLTSSWAGEIFLIRPDFSKESLLKTSDQEINSADIGFNVREQVVYVPTFFDNRVVAYKLVKSDS